MKTAKLLGLGLGLVCLSAIHVKAQGTFNATYTFAGVTTSSGTVDPTPVPTADGVTFGSFTAVGYTGSANATGRFSWTSSETGGISGDDDFTHFTGGLNEGKYFEVTLTPVAAFELSLDSLSFGVRRSGSGIRSYAIRSSLDGFASNLAGSISPVNANLGIGPDNSFRWLFDATATTADQLGSRVLLGGAYSALTDPVTFRLYGWNAESAAGTFSIDDVLFSGSVLPVPEPGYATLWALGLGLLCIEQRRRRRLRLGWRW